MTRFSVSIAFLLALNLQPGIQAQTAGNITTFAGNGTSGFTGDGGMATSAEISSQVAVAADKQNNVYILDEGNSRVRKVNAAGIINTIAGGGNQALTDGVAATATKISATDIKVDGAGNIFLATGGPLIKIDTSGNVHFVTQGFGQDSGDGGPANAAVVSASSVALDPAGNIYIAEINTNRIRKVDTSGIIHTIAGNGTAGYSGDGGPAVNATVNLPQGIAADGAGNVYFADNTFYVRKIDTSGNISTFAGNGQAFNGSSGPPTSIGIIPTWVAADLAGNVFINDTGRVWKVAAGTATIIAGGAFSFNLGDGGPATSASLEANTDIAVDTAGNLYIADGGHYRVREVFGVAAVGGGTSGSAPVIAADGVVNGASFGEGIVSGSWASVEGNNLAAVTDNWDKFIVNGNLPTAIDGVSVTVGDEQGYVYYVSSTQINFIVPPNVPNGSQPVVVRNSNGTSSAVNTTVVSFAPAFFGWPNNQVVATRQDFSYAAASGTFASLATTPAKQGDVIILWGTGFGVTTPAVLPGIEVPSTVIYNTSTLPAVTVGNVSAKVLSAALTPGFAGLYQVAIQVPTTLANGIWPVEATIGGVSSPTTLMLAVVGP